ncbi:class I SAM-dependent methyltransferase [Alteribacter natronophilus]|uniref:class I SAM-dependent methyltransferase n=1 Tax=Alteribacter natronophilus TaxID=2583810 RepID=UPI00110DFF7A|nr:class I SAM-dependent methyltransferase [Alteribacter natronophilus]TMW70896.1 class I SAM-dependent methyltransferase [Alteribacter natronophilus]
MKQNKYDEAAFFNTYSRMNRSVKGLEGAGEWPVFRELIPHLQGKNVLDLGCGFGWHCRYAADQGAAEVTGVDISRNMLEKAREKSPDKEITFVRRPLEDFEYESDTYDVIISSLAFHYVRDFRQLCHSLYKALKPGGTLVFSVEHPIFTSRAEQDWFYSEDGRRLHWPVDRYQEEGERRTNFLAEDVVKYHRTVSTYIESLLQAGFLIRSVKEPAPSQERILENSEWQDEARRPMFLIVSAAKEQQAGITVIQAHA